MTATAHAPANVRADLERLLRARQLDRTLTTTQPEQAVDEGQRAATGVARLDERLGGGWPRGEQSEIVGRRSSGRTSLLLASLAAATARGEAVAFVDTCDTLDVASAVDAGVDLELLLWVRGPRDSQFATRNGLDCAVKAFNTVLQAGGFGLVALDVCDVPASALRSLPYTTWMRLQRVLLGASTAALLVGAEPLARSARGVTVDLGCTPPRAADATGRWTRGLFNGLDVTARVLHGKHVRWGNDDPVIIGHSHEHHDTKTLRHETF